MAKLQNDTITKLVHIQDSFPFEIGGIIDKITGEIIILNSGSEDFTYFYLYDDVKYWAFHTHPTITKDKGLVRPPSAGDILTIAVRSVRVGKILEEIAIDEYFVYYYKPTQNTYNKIYAYVHQVLPRDERSLVLDKDYWDKTLQNLENTTQEYHDTFFEMKHKGYYPHTLNKHFSSSKAELSSIVRAKKIKHFSKDETG